MKRILIIACFIFCMFLIYSFADTTSVYAASTEDIGYYDIWLYSDGVTWQNGIGPGSYITATFTVSIPATSSDIKNVDVEFLDTPQGKYTSSYYKCAVKSAEVLSSSYLGNKSVKYTIGAVLDANNGYGLDITKEYQADLVQGRRYYLPVEITWTYKTSGNGGWATIWPVYKGVWGGCNIYSNGDDTYTAITYDLNGKVIKKEVRLISQGIYN